MHELRQRSIFGVLKGSIAFHFFCFIAIVVAYNRLVYAIGSPSGRVDFSAWAAPLYAGPMPIPPITPAVIARWAIPILLAVAWIAVIARWTRGAAPSFGRMLRTALAFCLLLNVTTAMMDAGMKSITWPFSRIGDEFFGDAEHLESPGHLLRDYPTMTLSHHAHTHPPGGVLLLWIVRKTLGEGLMTASMVAIVISALVLLPAALLARRFLPANALAIFLGLYVFTPNLVLFGATSMDGVFSFFVVTTACFFFAAACDRAPRNRTILRAVNVGLWLALSTFFTYATFALVTLSGVWCALQFFVDRRQFVRTLIILSIAALTLVGCFGGLYALTGCNIIACLRMSIAFDAKTMFHVRASYWDASFTNILGILAGSGLLASTLWMRSLFKRSEVGRLCQALAITMALLSFSTLFTRELERIWMFLTPILLVGAAATLDRLEPLELRRKWIYATLVLLFVQTWLTQLLLNTVW